jgi:hypothetical protein
MKKTTKFKLDLSKINVNEPDFCYFLGLVASDGYIDVSNNRICFNLAAKDATILEPLIRYFSYTGSVCYSTTKVATYTRLNIVSKELVLEVIKHIAPKQKTFSLRLPQLPHMKAFVRGYLDGDGNIRNGFRCTTASELFMNELKDWFNVTYGTALNVTRQKTKFGDYPKIETSGKRAVFILKDIYSTGLAIERKRKSVYDIVRSYEKENRKLTE